MNGDIGLTVLDARQQLRVIFTQAGAVRWISPLRLPDHPSPLLTRELAYTAITRAKAECTLLEGREGMLELAAETETRRQSGLGEGVAGLFHLSACSKR